MESIFTGTPNELAAELLSEYAVSQAFGISQANYSPSADVVVGNTVYSATSGSNTLSIRFDNSDNEQLTDLSLFDDSYINFPKKILRKGQVYQLTFLAVYVDSEDNTQVYCPPLPGNWAEWETYWSENTPSNECTVYAAVNLIEGYPVNPYEEQISGYDIQDGAVDSDTIEDGSVGTADIADGAVTPAKLSESYVPKIIISTVADLPEASEANAGKLFVQSGLSGTGFYDWETGRMFSYEPGHIYRCRETSSGSGLYRWYDDMSDMFTAQIAAKQTKSLYFSDKSIASEDWTADTTYTDYGYKCDITCAGVTASMLPTVMFAHAEAISGNYSPIAVAGTGIVTVYSKVNTAITIPTIKCEVTS